MSFYDLGIFGNPSAETHDRLSATISRMIREFGLSVGADVILHNRDTIHTRNTRSAFAAAYFGGETLVDSEIASTLAGASLPIIPVAQSDGNFAANIPEAIRGANGLRLRTDDTDLTELAVAMLECVGLLRRQRRVFISG